MTAVSMAVTRFKKRRIGANLAMLVMFLVQVRASASLSDSEEKWLIVAW